MNRNRLDEIVEEEWVGRDRYAGQTIKRIAERAFRHGVERAVETCLPEMGWPVAVQPGPAADPVKEMGERLMQTARSYADGTNPDLKPAPAEEKHVCGYGCSLTGHGPVPDRRKWQRRITVPVLRLRQTAHAGAVRMYQPTDSVFCRDDRRSGKDRRKP